MPRKTRKVPPSNSSSSDFSSSSRNPTSSSYKSSTSGYVYSPASPRRVSSSYDSTPRRIMPSLSGTSSPLPKSSSKSYKSPSPPSPPPPSPFSSPSSPSLLPPSYHSSPSLLPPSYHSSPSPPHSSISSLSSLSSSPPPPFNPHVKATKRAGCKGKKIVECNTTPGCKYTTGNKRNFCRTTKNTPKMMLGDADMEMLIAEVRDAYADDAQLEYVIGRIRKTKCKFTPNYKSTFTGRKFTGEGKVYLQAMDKIHTFFKDGDEKVF